VILLSALALPGCLRYEYEQEFWLRVDGGGSVSVTGQPRLWAAFKGLPGGGPAEAEATLEAARTAFERSGLRIRRLRVTHRQGRAYVQVAADFDDVNRLGGSPAFPELRITFRESGGRLLLAGDWTPRPPVTPQGADSEELVAVRFHLPSKIYEHKNASAGVERGNILAWREPLAQALAGRGLDFGATLDARSILWSTVNLFAASIAAALLLLAAIAVWVVRAGRGRDGPTAS